MGIDTPHTTHPPSSKIKATLTHTATVLSPPSVSVSVRVLATHLSNWEVNTRSVKSMQSSLHNVVVTLIDRFLTGICIFPQGQICTVGRTQKYIYCTGKGQTRWEREHLRVISHTRNTVNERQCWFQPWLENVTSTWFWFLLLIDHLSCIGSIEARSPLDWDYVHTVINLTAQCLSVIIPVSVYRTPHIVPVWKISC